MPDGQKWTTYFFITIILSSTYFTVYRGGPRVLLQRKLFQGSRRGLTFSRGVWGGSNFFLGGPNRNI